MVLQKSCILVQLDESSLSIGSVNLFISDRFENFTINSKKMKRDLYTQRYTTELSVKYISKYWLLNIFPLQDTAEDIAIRSLFDLMDH